MNCYLQMKRLGLTYMLVLIYLHILNILTHSKQGASLVPRRFCFVKKIQTGRLGSSSSTPLVKGVVTNLDKLPWNNITPLEAKIESQFLKAVYTGQSISSF